MFSALQLLPVLTAMLVVVELADAEASAAVATSHIDRQLARFAATKCCDPADAQCCFEAIRDRGPLACPNIPLDELEIAFDCIHQELFPNASSIKLKTPAYQDLPCCDVYTRNDNDRNDSCKALCSRTLLTPAMSSKERLSAVTSCPQATGLAKCFKKCLRHLRSTSYRRPFDFNEHCHWKHRMLAGEYYIGGPARVL